MKQSLSTYRYASARSAGEGLRIGVARHVPRGIRREDRVRLGYFDLWVPLLAPDAELVKSYWSEELSFESFARHYRAELKKKESWQVVELLAGITLFMPISLGCFCEDELRCHRSVLKEILVKEAKAGVFLSGRLQLMLLRFESLPARSALPMRLIVKGSMFRRIP